MMNMKKNRALQLVALSFLLVFCSYDIFIRKADAKSKVHIVYMGEKQHDNPECLTSVHHEILSSVLGSKETAMDAMVYSYKHGFSGFAAKLTESQAHSISGLPGVIRVMPNHFYSLQTTRTWDYLDLSHHTPKNLFHDTEMGDGIIIGLLDTGVWPESKIFNDEGLGPIPTHWKGKCESGQLFNAATNCNNKLIGAKWFIDGFLAENEQPFNTTENPDYMSPRDSTGHGTHTSTIAGGSFVHNASYKGLGVGLVRGGAPKAHLCWVFLLIWRSPREAHVA